MAKTFIHEKTSRGKIAVDIFENRKESSQQSDDILTIQTTSSQGKILTHVKKTNERINKRVDDAEINKIVYGLKFLPENAELSEFQNNAVEFVENPLEKTVYNDKIVYNSGEFPHIVHTQRGFKDSKSEVLSDNQNEEKEVDDLIDD